MKEEKGDPSIRFDYSNREINPYETKVRVLGAGGAGNNTITHLMKEKYNNIKTISINTDAQDLLDAVADQKILIGRDITNGLGAGGDPMIGESAAEETKEIISNAIDGTDMLFLTGGMGGGTGTGSLPVVGQMAKEKGILTIAIVTMPFSEEGIVRWENAQIGLEKLRKTVDTLMILENDTLSDLFPDIPISQAFRTCDELLINALIGISNLLLKRGLINLDFADICTVMRDGPNAVIGMGESSSEKRGEEAVRKAISHPMMTADISGAQSALVHVAGGPDMTLREARTVIHSIVQKLDPNSRVIWGATVSKNMKGKISVLLILSGLPENVIIRYKASGIIGAELNERRKREEMAERAEQSVDNGRTIFDIKESIMETGSEVTTKPKVVRPMSQTTMIFYKIFEEEASGDLKRYDRAIHLLRENPDNRRALLDAKQACKLLKASSQMFGFDEVSQLISSIDSILTCVQSKEIVLTSKVLDSIALAMEMVVDLIDNKSDGRGETGYIVDRLEELKKEQLNTRLS